MQILILLNTHIQLRFLPFYFYFKVCSQDRIRTCIVENLQNQYLCHLLALPIAPPDLLMLKDTEKVFSIQYSAVQRVPKHYCFMPKNTQILACRDCKALLFLYSQFFQLIASLFRYGGLVIWAVLPMWHASALHSLHSRVTSPS